MDSLFLSHLVMAGTAGLFAFLTILVVGLLFFAPQILARLWQRTSKALALTFVLGYAVIAMAAVTQVDLVTQVKNILAVANGGSGAASFTAHKVLLGEGTSPFGTADPTSNSGYVLTSNGTSSDPTFQAVASAPNDYQETPSGTINGSNVTFTLAHTPASATNVNLFLNGVQQRQGAGNDYTISSATITYLTAPPTGSTLNAIYF